MVHDTVARARPGMHPYEERGVGDGDKVEVPELAVGRSKRLKTTSPQRACEQLQPQGVRERFSLDERYKLVLPELMNRPKPSSEPWWPVFRRIQGLAALTRHAIYEPVERSGLSGKKPLAERFYTGEYVGSTRMLFQAFEHFSPNWVPTELRSQWPRRGP